MIGKCGLTQPLLFVFCRSESMALLYNNNNNLRKIKEIRRKKRKLNIQR